MVITVNVRMVPVNYISNISNATSTTLARALLTTACQKSLLAIERLTFFASGGAELCAAAHQRYCLQVLPI